MRIGWSRAGGGGDSPTIRAGRRPDQQSAKPDQSTQPSPSPWRMARGIRLRASPRDRRAFLLAPHQLGH